MKTVLRAALFAFAEAKGPVYYFGRPPPDLDLMIVTVARIVVLVIITRLLVLFPAVAVDAPGAGTYTSKVAVFMEKERLNNF